VKNCKKVNKKVIVKDTSTIYKYSDNCYDPLEWMIPGLGYLDGTFEGALKAGQEAYPP